MLKTLFASALFAGVAAGVLMAFLHQTMTVPLILEAELYETGVKTHFAGAETAGGAAQIAEDGHAHSHGPAPAGEGFDVTRLGYSALVAVLSMSGFALLMTAGFAIAERMGARSVDAAQGLLWGMAGFLAVQLFPAMGLAPEVPGASAAALETRQVWWLSTVALSVAGIAALAYGGGFWRFGGVLLIALPHVIGAPHPAEFAGVAPPELAGLFAARALGVAAVAWLALGATAGWIWARRGNLTAAQPAHG